MKRLWKASASVRSCGQRLGNRRLTLETLERREVLYGNLSATIVGSDLNIVGDAMSNYLVLWTDNNGDLNVAGSKLGVLPGSETTVNGQQTPQVFTGFTGNVNIDLGSGDDQLYASHLELPGDLNIVGSGTATVVFYTHAGNSYGAYSSSVIAPNAGSLAARGEVHVQGSLAIDQSAGTGLNMIVDSQFHIDGDMNIHGSTGNDNYYLWQAAVGETRTVAGRFNLDTNTGYDLVSLVDLDVSGDVMLKHHYTAASLPFATGFMGGYTYLTDVNIGGDLTVEGSIHGDYYRFTNVTADYANISTGNGQDRVELRDSQFTNLILDFGAGNDGGNALLGAMLSHVQVASGVTIDMGAGNDSVNIDTLAAATIDIVTRGGSDGVVLRGVAGTSLNIDTGSEGDVVGVYDTTATDLNLLTGDGNEGNGFFGVVLGNVSVTNNLAIDTGAGLDNVLLSGVTATGLQLRTGTGSDGAIVRNVTAGTALIDLGDAGDVLGMYDDVFDNLQVLLGNGFDNLHTEAVTVHANPQTSSENPGNYFLPLSSGHYYTGSISPGIQNYWG